VGASSANADPPTTSDLQIGSEQRREGRSLERAYELFNERRIDDLLAMMADEVQWPDVAHGVALKGKLAIGRYWEAQFSSTRPFVVPTDFKVVGAVVIAVVDQQIFDLMGTLLTDPVVVFHRYSFTGAL
jgi:hypothetical protein